jgi:hypothetical protein
LNVNGELFYSAADPAHGTELHAATPTGAAALNVDLGSGFAIDEGDTKDVTFTAKVTGGTAKTFKWYFGDGKSRIVAASNGGAKQSFSYTDFSPGTVSVRVIVRMKDGRIARGQVTLTINNIAPTVKLKITQGSSVTVPYYLNEYTVNIKDPGKNEKFTIDWTFPDGTKAQVIATKAGSYAMPHRYFSTVTAGFVTVGVTDSSGGYDHASKLVTVQAITVAKLKLGYSLLIGGVKGPHKFVLEALPTGVEVLLDGLAELPPVKLVKLITIVAPPTDQIVIPPVLKHISTVLLTKH